MEDRVLINSITDEMLNKRPLSYSRLKDFRISPKHFIYYMNNSKEEKDSWVIGKATEALVFEPENFNKKFMVYEKPPQRTDAAKEQHRLVLEDAKKRKVTLIHPDDVKRATLAAQSVMDNNESRQIIEARRKFQIELKWTDRKTQIPLIGYVDFESYIWDTDFICDFKTTSNADPDVFHRDIFKFDYILQCGCYREGYKRLKYRFPTMLFIAVETVEPFNVSVNYCDSKFNKRAEEEFIGSLTAFRYCMDKNLWHQGYEFRLFDTLGYFPVSVPPYYKNRFVSYNFDEDESGK